ncbi:MAG: UDP-N-acetylglucosamine 2-epimerase [Candidatus Omnitrophica bacterium]|nr:UDP-N-acetylglucosamine 2-epimerase [Candidatus Omnitrophota bacterium]MDD5591882.1 UDP-N-acetylglucosamine 2-epimerase [Candidatus Omnitrophota bacterium]
MKRKICVFTGTRAEYGILRPLLIVIKNDPALKLQLVVSGMHLLPEFGSTYKEIEKDGFKIDKKVGISLNSDTPFGLSRAVGAGLISFSKAFKALGPDIIVIVGDRFEAFSAAVAALVLRIPIAHIHGGEATFGVIDEAFRHAITKMSHLHFTSAEEYRRRVIQLGEYPVRVFKVGALGLDNLKKLRLLSKKAIEQELHFKFNKHNLLITYHPVTLENNTSGAQFRSLLQSLDELRETALIFTKANADMDGRIINKLIDEYVAKNSSKAVAFTSMGQRLYLSTMQFVDAIVGNSSSGIIEAPSFKIGTINIGDRQKGRIKAKSIIDCRPIKKEITNAIRKLYSRKFQSMLRGVANPYGDGKTAPRIKKILKNYGLKNIIKKEFYDIPVKNKERQGL